TGYQNLVDLVLAGPAEHHGLAPDRLETRMPGVVVGDGDDRRLGLGDGVPRLWVGRIGQDDTFAAAHTDAGVSEPGHVHGAGRESRNSVPADRGARVPRAPGRGRR